MLRCYKRLTEGELLQIETESKKELSAANRKRWLPLNLILKAFTIL